MASVLSATRSSYWCSNCKVAVPTDGSLCSECNRLEHRPKADATMDIDLLRTGIYHKRVPRADGGMEYDAATDMSGTHPSRQSHQPLVKQMPGHGSDPVNSPPHYRKGEVETIDFIDQTVDGYADPRIAYYLGNVLKYIARAPHKGNMQQDLSKAEFYLRRAINRAASLKR